MFPLNEETEWILGRPNFWCASGIVPALRASGQQIPKKAEAEQAAAIYWMLTMYEQYGQEWRERAGEELDRLFAAAAAKIAATQTTTTETTEPLEKESKTDEL